MSNDQINTSEEQASYGVGLQMGKEISSAFEGVSISAALAGIEDVLEGNEPRLGGEEINAAYQIIKERIKAEQKANFGKTADAGEAFLVNNAQREEVSVLASGLQYEVVTTGDGEKPSASSTVRTHYRGTLINGTEFDSSYKRNEPTEFPVNGVIAGWTEALQLMTVGSKWRLFIPYQLAYGEQGAGGAIGPFQALIFDIELLAIL